jgi:hypothetical protein
MRSGRSGDFRDGSSHGVRGGASNPQVGASGAVHGTFHGKDFNHFTSQERDHWQHDGHWRHSWHNGHFGWWWFLDDFWFFYPEVIYPYPTYVGTDYYYDDNDYDSDYSWYWCDDPEGYYPYVQECYDEWQPVSPRPY